MAGLTGLKLEATVKLKAPTKAELNAALSGLKGEKTVKIAIDSADAATRIAQIRTLLTSLGTTVSGLFNINTAGFGAILSGGTAMITQFQAVVAELKRVLAEIRNTRPPNGPPAGGGGGGGGANLNPYAAQLKALQGDLRNNILSTAQFETATRALKAQIDAEIVSLRSLGVLTADQQRKLDALRAASGTVAQALGRVGTSAGAGIQQLGRELGVAQSQYERGAIGLRTYLREMERIRTAGASLATGLRAGSTEARNLERVMGGLSTAARNINSTSITKIRTDMAAARAEFERATVAAGSFTAKRAALQSYEASMRALEQRIQAVGQRSNVSEKQMRALAQATQQLASQRGALQGIFTPLGLSGGILNALRSLPQFAAQAGGSLGAAAAQATGFAGGLGGILAAAGPVGLAIAGVTAGVVAFTAAGVASVGAFGTFENGIQNAKATLGLFGEEGKALGKELAGLAQDPSLTKLGFNSNQAAAAIEELGSRGLSTSEIISGGLQTAAKLAAASGVKDLTVSSEILVGSMRAFGLEGAAAAKVPDLLAAASNVSALRLDDFRLAIAAGGSAARTAGIDITEFTTVMSLMRDRLIGASDAGTSFKAFTAAFTSNSQPAQAAMDKIGFSAFDSAGKMKSLREITQQLAEGLEGYTDKQRLATLETIYGSDGIRTATTLLDAYNGANAQGTRLLDERSAAVTQTGLADLAAKERTDSLVAAQAELSNKILLLKQSLGAELAPAAEAVVVALTGLVDWLGKTGPALEELRGYLIPAGVALIAFKGSVIATATTAAWGTLAGVLTALPALIAAVGASLAAFVASNPIGLIATVAAGIAVYANNIFNDIQKIYDATDQLAAQSSGTMLARVAELNAVGTELADAQARHLLALDGLTQAQKGNFSGSNFFTGERYFTVDPEAVKAAETRLAAAKAELEAAKERNRIRNPNTLPGQGPLQPGQVRTGPASDFGLAVAQQTLIKTGNQQADAVVNFCSKWVRLTLGQAQPEIAGYINRIFSDSNSDGRVNANDAANNARKAGLLRGYTGVSDLKPGDTVFYEDGGDGHVGIYIGDGLVRGNNRVSNKATGNPVGNVGVNQLGKVTGFVRADDLAGAAKGGQAGTAAGNAAATAAANTQIEKLNKQAQSLYNQQQLALKSGNKVWLTKVNTDIAAFKKAHANVWKTITQTNKDGSASSVKAAEVTAAEYAKFQKRAKELAALEARTKGQGAASAAAGREIAAFTKNNPVAAKVLDFERQALKERERLAKEAKALAKKASDEQASVAREAAQGQVAAARSSLERLKTIQTRALVNAGDDVTARAKIARDGANAIAGAEKKIAAAQLKIDQTEARGLAPANRQAGLDQAQTDYANSLREIETDRLRAIKESGKTIQEEQSKLDQQLREGRVADARLTLDRITGLNERELIRFKGTAEQRIKIVARQAGAEASAALKVAQAQKKSDDAAARALPAGEQAAALARSKKTFENAQREIENTRLRVVREGNDALKAERDQFEAQLREGRVADARLTLDRIAGLNERELVRFKGTAEERIKIVTRQAGVEAAAKLKLAEAQKKLDDAAAKALPAGQQAAALTRSKTTFENAQREIETTRLRVVREGNDALKAERDQFDAQVREGQVAQARLTLERIEQLNEQELQRFAGTAAQREVIIRRQADAELAAKKQIAVAQKKIDDAAARALAPALQAGALGTATTTSQNAIRAAQIDRDRTVQEAKAATREELTQSTARQKAVQALERDLRQLNERFAQQVKAGTVTADSVLRYKQALEDLRAKASELPATLQATIKALLTQSGTLGTQGQGIANYRSEIDKLREAVEKWAYAELTAARARVIANGGDPKKLALLDAEIAKRKTLTGVQLGQLQAENAVAAARTGSETLEGQLGNAQAQAKGNLATLYQLELDFGEKIQTARDARARVEADEEIRQVNEKYKKLGELEGLSRQQRLELAAAQDKALADIDTRLGIVTAKNASDRSAAELNAKNALDAALLSADRATRDTIRKNALDLLARQTADLEARQAEELSAEGLTQAQVLEIRKRFQPLLVAQKQKEVAASREIETQAENDRYSDAVEAARQNGTLQTVAAKLLAEHTSNLGAIERRGTDAVRDYELSTKRDVGQAVLAAAKATSDDLVKVGQERIDRELEGLSEMNESQRQLAVQTLEFWREVYTAQGTVGKAAMADVDAAIAKIGAAGRTARRQTADLGVVDAALPGTFARDLNGIGKDEDADDARATAEAKYNGLLETYQGFLKKTEDAARQFEGLSDDQLTPDERLTRDGLLANIVLYDGFIAQITGKAKEAGTKAAAAFTQAEADKTEEARLALAEAEYARAQQAGTDGSVAYRAGLNTSLAYWRARKDGLKTDSPEYLAALQKVTELEGKLLAVSPEKTADQNQLASQALDEAEYARAQQAGTDGSPAYREGLNASLAYWKARLVGLDKKSPEYLAALQQVTDLEGKIKAITPEKLADQEQEASQALLEVRYALAEAEGKDGSPAYIAGLNASLAYWRARLEGLKNDAPAYLAALQRINDLEGKIGTAQANTPLVNRLKNLSGIVGKNGTFQKTVTAGLDGLAAYFGAGGAKSGRKAILAGAEALVGGLGEVFKTGNEETDQVISTFVSGVQGTLSALAKGDWIGAIIAGVATVVSTILDIFQGGKKSMAKAKAEIEEATKGIKFFDLSKYAKVESRGGFWGFLGFKKSVIDQESVDIARTLGDAIYDAISGGMLDGIKAGKTSFGELGIDLKKSLAQNILQGLIDGFLQGAIMKDLIQPFLDQYIAARKTADPTDDVKAAADLQAAIVTGNNELAQFYQGVLVPTAQQLGVFGSDATSASAGLGGNAAQQLELPQSVQVALRSTDAQAQAQNTAALSRVIEKLDGTVSNLQRSGLTAEVLITQQAPPATRARARTGYLF
ncbi:phage tail tape measure protein [Deinococcus sp. QL22]|uniref:phage tail tape measure protein n=1 Tax=Deinococcus sp. QL22 TaxID=2939437 RepID=UPI002018331C|nr:phage tail tape measure protein [Deinococcus sp. QL22]UQN10358.1 phage tail tape measure protein [Deinococcus sp. QL22]UQN10492.1 phage tail tape measure protein [Deinococcus sp. QL22]